MSKNELIKRYSLFVVSLFFSASHRYGCEVLAEQITYQFWRGK